MELWWGKYNHKHRPRPHLFRRRHCGIAGHCDKISEVSCTERKDPCPWCGQTPLCAPDCVAIRVLLSDSKAYVIGNNPFEG